MIQQIVAPVLVMMLLVQFAPLGLVTSAPAMDRCPHCSGSAAHGNEARAKCMHHGMHASSSEHRGMKQMHHQMPRYEGPSFCACGSDDTPLTILPAIGKTLISFGIDVPRQANAKALFPSRRVNNGRLDSFSVFHPPRLV